jgi:hypothetical protein
MVLPLLFLALTLPADISMSIRLETVLDSAQSKVGDPVVGVLTKDAKLKGKPVLPKKTLVRGYIRVLEYKKDQVTIGLEFTEVESPDMKANFIASLEEIVSALPGMGRFEHGSLSRTATSSSPLTNGSTQNNIVPAINPILPNNSPGLGTFYMRSTKFKLKDFEMIWRTLPSE